MPGLYEDKPLALKQQDHNRSLSQDASVDSKRLPTLPSCGIAHAPSTQNPAALDDGDARNGRSASRRRHPRLTQTHQVMTNIDS